MAAESPGGVLLLCNTSSTVCSVLVPPGARTLHVTAHNSRGSSSPASITLSQGAGGQEGRISHTPTAALTEIGFYQDCRRKMLACAKAREKLQQSPAHSTEGTQHPPDKASIPRRWRCSAATYHSPWTLKAAATSLKISLSCLRWLGTGVLLCSSLPKIAPAASARETVPAVTQGEEKGRESPFWATLGSSRHRLRFSPQPHFPIFEKCLF